MFDVLYQMERGEIAGLLGDYYITDHEQFEHGKDVLIAHLKSAKDDDGQDVMIYECRMPARFFIIKALDTPNSVGEINKGFTLSTDSGQDKLVYDIAMAIHQGMLELR